jgi:hypothetical protein
LRDLLGEALGLPHQPARCVQQSAIADTGETTIEPTHESLLRQWSLLQGWLKEAASLLTLLGGIKRASRDWAANAKAKAWLAHNAERLNAANRLAQRPDLAANLEPTDRDYLAACRGAEQEARARVHRTNALVGVLALLLIGARVGCWKHDSVVTSGTKSRSEPPESVPNSTSIDGELHRKRCSEAMTLVTVLSKFGDRPRFKIFRCTARGFYDSVKA